MLRKPIAALAVCALFSAGSPAISAEEIKIPIWMSPSSNNTLREKRFIYEIKEAIRKSATLRLAEKEDEAIHQAHMVVIDAYDGVAYSLVRVWKLGGSQEYVTSYAGVCSEDNLVDCSRSVLSILATGAEEDKKIFAEVLRQTDSENPRPKAKM